MRILVLSDTHITDSNITMPEIISKELKRSDCCLHAGDLTIYPVYRELSKQIKTYAVAGNMDDELTQAKLPKKQIISLGGFEFGLIHGFGSPHRLDHYIDYQFQKNYGKIDIFIFGHSHQPSDKEKRKKIYFNPGSAGGTISPKGKTYGIVEIENKKIKRSIKKIG